MKKKALLSALFTGGFLLASCGGGGSSDTTSLTGGIDTTSYASIEGRIVGNPQTASISTADYAVGNDILRYISAVTFDNGQLIAVSSEIDNDGAFELTLLKDKNYIFTLFDVNGEPVASTIGKTFVIEDNDIVTIKLEDTDNDGTPDNLEVQPEIGNIEVVDNDALVDNDDDNLPDILKEIDKDNDGIEDISEFLSDKNGNGIPDSAEDKDNDNIPDIIDDHDGNGIPDIFEDKDNDGMRDVFEHMNENQKENQHENKNKEQERGKHGKDKERGHNDERYIDNHNDNDIKDIMNLPYEDLSDVEEQGILFMREEEKLARDVYKKLGELYPEAQIFQNIAQSEQRHMDAVKALIDKYNLPDPVESTNDQIGVFQNAELQKAYNDLIERGSQSLEEALKVGAYIEELDIIDLEKRIEEIDNQDIKLVYENLERGSRNHLRAFVSNLEKQGVSYEPQLLPNDKYQEIISSDMERGHGWDNDTALIVGYLGKKEGISTTSVETYAKYVAAYAIHNNGISPALAEIDNDGTFRLRVNKNMDYVFALFDENGEPLAFNEGEEYKVKGNTLIGLYTQDVDNDGYEEIEIEAKDENIQKVENPALVDNDFTRIPDILEKDHDNDGIEDFRKAVLDENGNHIPDLIENHRQNRGNNREGRHGNNNQNGMNNDNHRDSNQQNHEQNRFDDNRRGNDRENHGQNGQNNMNENHQQNQGQNHNPNGQKGQNNMNENHQQNQGQNHNPNGQNGQNNMNENHQQNQGQNHNPNGQKGQNNMNENHQQNQQNGNNQQRRGNRGF